MNFCGAKKFCSPEYGKPNLVNSKTAIDIRNIPINNLNIYSIFLTNNISGGTKPINNANKRLVMIEINISELKPAPIRPITGINKYKAPINK